VPVEKGLATTEHTQPSFNLPLSPFPASPVPVEKGLATTAVK
jgi:hypothetical protein